MRELATGIGVILLFYVLLRRRKVDAIKTKIWKKGLLVEVLESELYTSVRQITCGLEAKCNLYSLELQVLVLASWSASLG
jgi:hypothetical protein